MFCIQIIPAGYPGTLHYEYYIKVVPMLYHDTFGNDVRSTLLSVTTNNYTVGTLEMAMTKIPGVFFFYQPSPYMIRVSKESKPFTRFLTSTFAIVGGVLTIAGILDSLLFHCTKCIEER